MESKPGTQDARPRTAMRAMALPLVLVAVVVVGLAGTAIASIHSEHREEEAARLEMVAQWRASQIHHWLDDRLAQARHTADGPAGPLYQRWRQRGDEALRERLLLRLAVLRESSGAHSAFIVGDDSAVVSDPARPPPERSYLPAAMRVLATGQPAFTDPEGGAPGTLWVDFVAPLRHADDNPQGVVVLRFEAANFFAPLLDRWPGPGDGRFSLIHGDGRRLAGSGEGPGDGALSRTVDIEGAPWSLRAEVSERHVYARAREQAVWISGFALMSLLACAAGLHLLGQRRLLREQAQRLQSLRLLQAVADSSLDIIYVKDRDGRYLLFNEQACRVTGRRAEDVLGKNVGDLYPGDAAQRFRGEDQAVLATGRPTTQDHEVETAHGIRVLHSLKAPLRDEQGRIVGLFGISRDITERHQAEQDLRRLSAELAQHRDHLEEEVQARTAQLACTNRALQSAVDELQAFSYTLSHDLRSPLQTIAGFGQALAEGESDRLTDTGRRRLERIQAAAARMDRMIDDLLACSRAERKPLERKSVDLHEMARETCAELAARYPGTRVEIARLPRVYGDPVLLGHAMSNLLGNAFKFSATSASPQVVVDATRHTDAWQVRVRDNGTGFDPAYADKLFQLFQRLHKETEFAGTGVGLAIVKRVVARHGGQVAAECVPGQWTTFSFTLPGS